MSSVDYRHGCCSSKPWVDVDHYDTATLPPDGEMILAVWSDGTRSVGRWPKLRDYRETYYALLRWTPAFFVFDLLDEIANTKTASP